MLYSSIFIAVLALVTPSAVALRAANAKQASSLEVSFLPTRVPPSPVEWN